jgi:DNA processing protein
MLSRNMVRVVSMQSPEYPPLLRKYSFSPPVTLYVVGQTLDWGRLKPVAVVGTRQPTDVGKELTKELVRRLVREGYAIVTGLARGVDSIAVQEALANNGFVIGVLPCMFKKDEEGKQVPCLVASYADELLRKGAVMSENYVSRNIWEELVLRNRLIDGMSIAVVIPETKWKLRGWGTVHHIRFGIKANKAVLIFKPRTKSKLVEKAYKYFTEEGARPVETIEEVMEVVRRLTSQQLY